MASADEALGLALVEGLQREEHESGARALHEAVDRHAGKLHGVLDARLLHADVADLLDDLRGAIERCRRRQLREGDQVLLVLRRDEPVRDGRKTDSRRGR